MILSPYLKSQDSLFKKIASESLYVYLFCFLNTLKPNLLCGGEEEIKKKRLEMLIPQIFGVVVNTLSVFLQI